jgi:hypothetical protein
MCAYAGVTDVQALLPEFAISGSSKPSITEVMAFITQIEAMINGVLAAQGYSTVPATGANDVALLAGVVQRKVAALTYLAAYQSDNAPDKIKVWNEEFTQFMNWLRQGQINLVDQLPQGDIEPLFGIVRHPTRDDYFTERWNTTDWDEG